MLNKNQWQLKLKHREVFCVKVMCFTQKDFYRMVAENGWIGKWLKQFYFLCLTHDLYYGHALFLYLNVTYAVSNLINVHHTPLLWTYTIEEMGKAVFLVCASLVPLTRIRQWVYVSWRLPTECLWRFYGDSH